jgi:predicted alpha/beta hydrolase family esterase
MGWAAAAEFVVAHSLGTAVALHHTPAFKPPPLGILTYGTFDTTKDLTDSVAPSRIACSISAG